MEWEPGALAPGLGAHNHSAFPPGVGGDRGPVGHVGVGCSGGQGPGRPGGIRTCLGALARRVPGHRASPDAVHSDGRCLELCPWAYRTRSEQSHENSGSPHGGGVSVLQRAGRTALQGWGRGTRPRWALTTLSPRPRRTMLREQYIDRARVAVFGKVSCAASSGHPVQECGRSSLGTSLGRRWASGRVSRRERWDAQRLRLWPAGLSFYVTEGETERSGSWAPCGAPVL